MSKKKKMTFLLTGIIVIVAALVASYMFFFHRANSTLTRNEIKIGNAVFEVEVAKTIIETTRGLSFRKTLDERAGMLFIFSTPRIQSFWMKDMNFPIDIIWIGGNKVLGAAENAAPQPGTPQWSLRIYSSPEGTDRALEVNAGMVARYGIKAGDAVTTGEID